MPLMIVRNDIVKMNVDVIVNSANPYPTVGQGVDGQIHKYAGKELLEARRNIGNIACGEAFITSGYQLPAKYVIHTVGPTHTNQEASELLRSCYRNSLNLALEHSCESIAFPLISTGVYGVNKAKALQIAIQTIHEFLFEHEMMVYIVVYDKESYQISEQLYAKIESYIDENYIEEVYIPSKRVYESRWEGRNVFKECVSAFKSSVEELEEYIELEDNEPQRSLEALIDEVDDTFSEHLFRMIDYKGMKDPEVYKKANIDRRLFSKIRSNKHYQPSKNTALSLAFALELNLDETKDLLIKAGYALSNSNKVDIIVKYFIEQKNYNIYELNEVLFKFTETTLGG